MMTVAPNLKAGLEIRGSDWKRLLITGAASLGHHLGEAQVRLFQTYAEELLAWNRRINLTRITAPAEIAINHFVDSLPGAGNLGSGWRVIDLGSGAGFPGIPLKIVRPDLKITLVDAVRKKVSFEKHICRLLGLSGIDCLHARIEDLGADPVHSGGYEAVVTRALADLNTLCQLAAPLLSASGILIAYRGRPNDNPRGQVGTIGHTWRVDNRAYRLPHTQAHRALTCCKPRS